LICNPPPSLPLSDTGLSRSKMISLYISKYEHITKNFRVPTCSLPMRSKRASFMRGMMPRSSGSLGTPDIEKLFPDPVWP